MISLILANKKLANWTLLICIFTSIFHFFFANDLLFIVTFKIMFVNHFRNKIHLLTSFFWSFQLHHAVFRELWKTSWKLQNKSHEVDLEFFIMFFKQLFPRSRMISHAQLKWTFSPHLQLYCVLHSLCFPSVLQFEDNNSPECSQWDGSKVNLKPEQHSLDL